MEKAILKTLVYADIFEFPLKVYEIHKWLIGKTASLRQIEKALERLRVKGKAERVKDYYVLSGRSRLIRKRQQRQKQSKHYLLKAKFACWFLKIIPWIILVGISGGLAMDNTDKSDDIDLILITQNNRLWISRFLAIIILDFMGMRRKAKMKQNQVAGKLCANIILDEENLEQQSKDLFVAHEVLQMKVLWSRGEIYQKYLLDNKWVFKFLPNWISNQYQVLSSKYNASKSNIHNTKYVILNTIFNVCENLAKNFQLIIMKKPLGQERIQDGALYFHPQDCRRKILEEYRQKVKKFSNT